MATDAKILGNRSLDVLIFDLEALKDHPELSATVSPFLEGDYRTILGNTTSQTLFEKLSETISLPRPEQEAALQDSKFSNPAGAVSVFITGLAAFNCFLQVNVTGPPLELRDVFKAKGDDAVAWREKCLKSLEYDGVSVYQHIPHVELFCLARMVFTVYFPRVVEAELKDCRWMRVRVNAFHQRLLSGVLGGRLSDSTLMQSVIDEDLRKLDSEILRAEGFSTEARVQFLLEKAQIFIMQGLELKAKENVKLAKSVSGFAYELSGALGKRTKFQQNDISQLVVFAKSRQVGEGGNTSEDPAPNLEILGISNGNVPKALELNDDTLLESIEFTKSDKIENSALPTILAQLQPDDQPQLNPLDQITLLAEATLKDVLSPSDKLNSEEILPYAVRVLADKPTNWQIYTQALLVRSRIESHRSRTQERSVLQLQAIVDQIIADTQEIPSDSTEEIPEIRVNQFLPRAKADESAPVSERLKYIYQLNTPTRWEIETELAYAWSNAGSLVSALDIFKRLKLWPEVALCFHSVNQEDKARRVVRRQLYYSSKGREMDEYDIDANEVVTEEWDGEMRSPHPPHSPRLWCILGDLNQDPKCWQRAWEISKNRYARAQRTLGEYYTKQGDLQNARESYMKATLVNRQNNDTWSRLGDIDLAVGNWDGAVIAFQQSIMIDDTDAKTYSNLGSALLSKHAELLQLQKAAKNDIQITEEDDEEEIDFSRQQNDKQNDPKEVLRQALAAYKRGAALAHDNWKIWDNVITIAGRMSPPSFPEILMGMRAVIRIRGPKMGEYAVDVDILRGLVLEVISGDRPANTMPKETEGSIYTPPRGSLARATIETVNNEIVPHITKRAELWALVEKLNLYRKDYENALRCAEKSWRVASAGEQWLQDVEAWKGVVSATDNLVSAYENYGPQEKESGVEIEKNWRMKARSAVKGTMGKARDVWEGTLEWRVLEERLEELKN